MICPSCPDTLTDLLTSAASPRCGGQRQCRLSAGPGCSWCGIVALADQLLGAFLDPRLIAPAGGEEAEGPNRSHGSDTSERVGIVEACLAAFAELGDPDAMASEDLVAMLRQAPGSRSAGGGSPT